MPPVLTRQAALRQNGLRDRSARTGWGARKRLAPGAPLAGRSLAQGAAASCQQAKRTTSRRYSTSPRASMRGLVNTIGVIQYCLDITPEQSDACLDNAQLQWDTSTVDQALLSNSPFSGANSVMQSDSAVIGPVHRAPSEVRTCRKPTADGGMRVLLLQTQAENAGAQEIARLLAAGLADRGHDIRQIFFYRRTAAFDGDERTVFCATARPTGPRALARLLWGLGREIRRFRPDVVLCFQHYGNVIGAPLARLAGVRHVIANQNSAGAVVAAPVRTADRWLGCLGVYSRIVAVSGEAAAEFKDHPRAYRSRLMRIDHGVAVKRSLLDRKGARIRFGLPVRPTVLGCAARLHQTKQLDAAVRLLPLNPTWHLALAGQGPDAARLRALARDLACAERLHLLGELGAEDIADFFAALDVFVFPSLAETFGIAAVEAAQAGVPVVANHLPVLREVLSVAGEPCAVFVDASDPAAFGAAVAGLVAAPGRAAEMAARGRRLAARYPIDAMVEAYDSLVRDLGAKQAAAP